MSTREPLDARVTRHLNDLEHAQLLRTLHAPDGVDLSSNDYLALASHPRLKARMIEAIDRLGCGSTGSRLLRGDREIFRSIESHFATLKRTERALYFSSGYLANISVLTTFPEAGDVIFSDERNHASLIDGIRLSSAQRVVFPHNDVDRLADLLDEHRSAGHMFVVTESLFSMDGDAAPLARYASLCRSRGASLIVDEAHAVGIYGPRGSGLIEANGVGDDVFVSINTAGKALGVSGAFVAGPAWAVEYLVQRARPFIFSTAAPPAVAAAIEASLEIVANEPERRETLARLSRRFRARLTEVGVAVPDGFSQIIPVVIGRNDRALAVAQSMQAQGFDVRAIRPPSVPEGTARLRISVNAGLTDAILDRAATALATAIHDCTPCAAVSS